MSEQDNKAEAWITMGREETEDNLLIIDRRLETESETIYQTIVIDQDNEQLHLSTTKLDRDRVGDLGAALQAAFAFARKELPGAFPASLFEAPKATREVAYAADAWREQDAAMRKAADERAAHEAERRKAALKALAELDMDPLELAAVLNAGLVAPRWSWPRNCPRRKSPDTSTAAPSEVP